MRATVWPGCFSLELDLIWLFRSVLANPSSALACQLPPIADIGSDLLMTEKCDKQP